MSTEIKRTTDIRKVLEERIFDSRVELTLWEVLKIAKKEVHDSIVDLVKAKKAIDGAGVGEAGGGTDDIPRGRGGSRRVGGKPLLKATLSQGHDGDPCADR
jgi:hypothetical protein